MTPKMLLGDLKKNVKVYYVIVFLLPSAKSYCNTLSRRDRDRL